MNEKQLIATLKKANDSLQVAEDNYSSFDCFTSKSILELKCRYGDRRYPDTMIELQKFEKNMEIAKEQGKDFFYVVYSQPHQQIFFFNVSKLCDDEYDFKWESKRCPQTTSFSRREYVEKKVGYIQWDNAVFTLPL